MNVVNINRRQTIPFVEPPKMVAVSAQMNQVLKLVERVAGSEVTTVLLQGETGVGKDMIAALLHEGSQSAAYPFGGELCCDPGDPPRKRIAWS